MNREYEHVAGPGNRDGNRAGRLARLVGLLLVVWMGGLAHAAPAGGTALPGYDPARVHALVIGIDAYADWPKLKCAANDARAIAGVLRETYGYKDVRLLLDAAASREGILDALDGYTALPPKDSLLIYYAGHGWLDPASGNGYWVPADARQDDKFSYVSSARIVNDYFKRYRVHHLLVVSDSCFSGSLLRSTPGKARVNAMAAVFGRPSRWVLTSGDLAPVPDGAGGGHSPFATRLLQYLKHGDESLFGILDLHAYVRKNLSTASIASPLDTPGHRVGGEFVFARLAGRSPAPAVAKPHPATGKVWSIPGFGLDLMPVAPGRFRMGSPLSSYGHGEDEPPRETTVAEAFWIGKTEITQLQYLAIAGKSPSRRLAPNHPVEWVSWAEAMAFCRRLNQQEQAAGRLPPGYAYRLPTETEWEYACRAGTTTAFCHGAVSRGLQDWAWFDANSDASSHAVGAKKPNAWGIHDMHGNVAEWCLDVYAIDPTASPKTDQGARHRRHRVVRGGDWRGNSRRCRSANRDRGSAGQRLDTVGFRVVLGPVASGAGGPGPPR